jgi:hypothetical protein
MTGHCSILGPSHIHKRILENSRDARVSTAGFGTLRGGPLKEQLSDRYPIFIENTQ